MSGGIVTLDPWYIREGGIAVDWRTGRRIALDPDAAVPDLLAQMTKRMPISMTAPMTRKEPTRD